MSLERFFYLAFGVKSDKEVRDEREAAQRYAASPRQLNDNPAERKVVAATDNKKEK